MTARPLALIKIPLVTGLCVMLISWIAKRFQRFVRTGLAAVAVVIISACAAGGVQYIHVVQTAGDLNPTGAHFANRAQGYYQEIMADPALKIPDEVAFYALNREIDLHDGTLTRLLETRAPQQ
jgi:hypothetical protein